MHGARTVVAMAAVAGLALGAVACSDDDEGGGADGTTAATVGGGPAEVAAASCRATEGELDGEAAAIAAVVDAQLEELGLRAALVRVERGDEEVVTIAEGEAMPGVAATAGDHFRNGAVTISQLGTVLLQLVDEGTVSVDDTIDAWLPELPAADHVTLGMLITGTSGYRDYESTPSFIESQETDPFQRWTPEELIEIGTSQPLWFEPGTNWSYAHTNFVILGQALERITDMPLDELLDQRFLEPAGMTQTANGDTPTIPDPVLHSYTSERGVYEEGTFWDPSWSLAQGAVQTTTVCDMATNARVVGQGELLSTESYELMVGDSLIGVGGPTPECPDACRENTERGRYGYGVVLLGDWVVQNPMFHGFMATMAHLPDDELTIAVSVTAGPATPEGNQSTTVADAIATELTGATITPGPPG